MSEQIPQWYIDRANQLIREARESHFDVWALEIDGKPTVPVRAFAKYLMQHEQEPVDPYEEAVNRILRVWYNSPKGNWKGSTIFNDTVAQYKKEIGLD